MGLQSILGMENKRMGLPSTVRYWSPVVQRYQCPAVDDTVSIVTSLPPMKDFGSSEIINL